MKKYLLLLALLFCVVLNINAQNTMTRNCGTMDYLSKQIKKDPTIVSRMNQIEQQTNQFLANRAVVSASATGTIVIPVVFHVVYNTTAQNISDAQCIAQLNQLNLDFARLNSDSNSTPSVFRSLAANTRIQFCLAQRDPNGLATTGIIHKSTTSTSFSSDDKVKSSTTGGDNTWSSTNYLNIWTCNLGNSLLGYAQFPGGTAATDGVVLLYSSVGSMAKPGTATPYQLGRTATHEVGHWLNLRHIWGDANCGSDLVNDTPTQQTSNSGCPTFPHITCSNGTSGDMYMNYMDYTNDACMNMFSTGQSTRMNAIFATGGARVSLLSSNGCLPVSSTTCGVPSGLAASAITSSGATLGWTAATGASSYNIQYRKVGTTTWTSTTSTTNSKSVSGLTASTSYEFQVQTACTGGTSAFSASVSFTTSATTTCTVPSGLSASSITSSSATLNWTAITGISSYNIRYRVSGTTTWTSTTSTTNSKAISALTAANLYEFQVQTVCSSSLSSTFSASATFTTLSGTSCISTYDNSTNGATSGAALIPFNSNITGLINTSTDVDYYKFNITTGGTIAITLTTLPADFDLYLYNSAGTQVGSSLNASTTSETINYTATSGTYYLKVIGYTGALSTSTCYTLKVALGTATRQDNSIQSEQMISIVPNPVREKLMISMKNKISRATTYTIIDTKGVVLREKQLTTNPQSIDVSDLNKGFYIIKINNAGVISTQKFIKQ
jgi:hypothetical protein